MCIQLKRFDYDWELNRSLKFDDYFEFPRKLDVAPYMYESINNKTPPTQTTPTSTTLPIPEDPNKMEITEQQKHDAKKIMYDLVGIVVHSGQANAGHYYSFIKGNVINQSSSDAELCELEELNKIIEDSLDDTKVLDSTGSSKTDTSSFKNEKWYKFNDTTVEEVTMTEATMIDECFGGTFTQSSEYKMLPEERVRYWNGYMLFYRVSDYNGLSQQSALREANLKLKQQRVSFSSRSKVGSDSLSELTELVSKGDEKGLFRTHMPSSIEKAVKSENLDFCKNRAVYDPDYFHFIYTMVRIFKVRHFSAFLQLIKDHFQS